jgi:hypothetical protein
MMRRRLIALDTHSENWFFSVTYGFVRFIKANKWMLATAGAALLVYLESSARRARSLSVLRHISSSPSAKIDFSDPMFR